MAGVNAVVPRIPTAAAQEKVASGVLLLDICDAPEIARIGRAEGSHPVPRRMLKFRVGPSLPYPIRI